MRISIENSFLYIGQGGVSRYIRQLTTALRALPNIQLSEVACNIPNFSYRQPRRALTTVYREYIWTPILSGREIAKQQPDVVHMTCFPDLKVPKQTPSVVTLHDLSQLRHPHAYRPYTRLRWKYFFSKMHQADAIITVSEFTKREAITLLGMDPEKIHAIPLSAAPLSSTSIQSALPPTLPSDFFLFVGSLSPRKNLELLNQTYRLARDRSVTLPALIVVGTRVEGVQKENPPPSNWIFLGRINDAELAELYRRAIALLYPSYYEGFGIPILEAMQAGCPVVCSPVASLTEAGGSAACYAEQNPESYLEQMQHLSRDLEFRSTHVAAGKDHAKTFSWDLTARKTSAVYRSVLSQRNQ